MKKDSDDRKISHSKENAEDNGSLKSPGRGNTEKVDDEKEEERKKERPRLVSNITKEK